MPRKSQSRRRAAVARGRRRRPFRASAAKRPRAGRVFRSPWPSSSAPRLLPLLSWRPGHPRFQGRSLKSRPPSPLNITSAPFSRSTPLLRAIGGNGRRAHRKLGRRRAAQDDAPPRRGPLRQASRAHRRPARFQLAVVRKNGPASKASLHSAGLEQQSDPCSARAKRASGRLGDVGRWAARAGEPGRLYRRAASQSGWKAPGSSRRPSPRTRNGFAAFISTWSGHIPPEEAVDAFLNNDGDHNMAAITGRAVVDRLLQDSGYARNWATVWANLLVGRQPRTPGVRRDDLEKFLRDSFAANVPWNETVFALVSAEGTADQNPAANFLLAPSQPGRGPGDGVDGPALPRRSGAVHAVPRPPVHEGQAGPFLGVQQLLPADGSRLARSAARRRPHRQGPHRQDSARPRSRRWRRGHVRAGNRHAARSAARCITKRCEAKCGPPFPFTRGHKIDPGPTVNRRRELARLIAQGDDRQLALAMVNRTWQHFFGHGFTQPVDDMGPHNGPNNPEVLNRLAQGICRLGLRLEAAHPLDLRDRRLSAGQHARTGQFVRRSGRPAPLPFSAASI